MTFNIKFATITHKKAGDNMTQDLRPVPNVVLKALFDNIISALKTNETDNLHELAEYAIIQYYQNGDKHFDLMQENFIDTYVDNESKIEGVHNKEEKDGLKLVYEYIFSNLSEIPVDVKYLTKLHEKLFSQVPFPEVGGQYRTSPASLKGAVVSLCPWERISTELQKTNKTIQKIVKTSDDVRQSNNREKLFNYIEECLRLKCKLIQIHPFADGNGRTVRAFTNKLFSLAEIPPVYVHYKEKKHYHIAMEKAISENDYSKILQFYYIKICQSIYELGINPNQDLKRKIDYKKIKKIVENYKVSLEDVTSNIEDLSVQYASSIKQELDEEEIKSRVITIALDKQKEYSYLVATLKKGYGDQNVLIDPLFANYVQTNDVLFDGNIPTEDQNFLLKLYQTGVAKTDTHNYELYLETFGLLNSYDKPKIKQKVKTIN